MQKQNPAAQPIMERERILRRLHDAGFIVGHSRLYGTEILTDVERWEPFSMERAKELLAGRETLSKLDVSNAKMRE